MVELCMDQPIYFLWPKAICHSRDQLSIVPLCISRLNFFSGPKAVIIWIQGYPYPHVPGDVVPLYP